MSVHVLVKITQNWNADRIFNERVLSSLNALEELAPDKRYRLALTNKHSSTLCVFVFECLWDILADCSIQEVHLKKTVARAKYLVFLTPRFCVGLKWTSFHSIPFDCWSLKHLQNKDEGYSLLGVCDACNVMGTKKIVTNYGCHLIATGCDQPSSLRECGHVASCTLLYTNCGGLWTSWANQCMKLRSNCKNILQSAVAEIL